MILVLKKHFWFFSFYTVEEELELCSLFGWLVADGWCWFVLREEYCWLVAGGWDEVHMFLWRGTFRRAATISPKIIIEYSSSLATFLSSMEDETSNKYLVLITRFGLCTSS
jgi:hypothetical protein